MSLILSTIRVKIYTINQSFFFTANNCNALKTKMVGQAQMNDEQHIIKLGIICAGTGGSNSGFPTSPHIMCVNLATRLLHQKNK